MYIICIEIDDFKWFGGVMPPVVGQETAHG
jgi:hypothetical protein